MLIVVAIIAILIAISIPLVNSALDKAKHSTDAANERAAKAVLMVEYLNGQAKASTSTAAQVYAYDAKEGTLIDANASPAPGVPVAYGKHKTHVNSYIIMEMKENGTVDMTWSNASSVQKTTVTDGGNALCINDNHPAS